MAYSLQGPEHVPGSPLPYLRPEAPDRLVRGVTTVRRAVAARPVDRADGDEDLPPRKVDGHGVHVAGVGEAGDVLRDRGGGKLAVVLRQPARQASGVSSGACLVFEQGENGRLRVRS